jgi:hypothetical protein
MLALCGQVALGQAWMTDDFDSYVIDSCVDPFCDCTPDQAAFQSNWQAGPAANVGSITQDGGCPSGFWGWDLPFAWQERKGSFQAVRSLLPAIQAAPGGAGMNAVNGTTSEPLVLTFHLYLKQGKQAFTSLWVQLFAGDPAAMLAPIRTEGLSSCVSNACSGGPLNGMACTSDHDCTAMKLDRTGPTSACNLQNNTPSVPRPAVAYGVYGGYNGLMPKPPCDNLLRGLNRYVIYDGDAWWQVKGGGSQSPPGSAGDDFPAFDKDTTVTLTIRETDMDLAISASRAGSCEANVCTGTRAGQPCESDGDCRSFTTTGIPRLYTGPFQGVAMGTGPVDDANTAQEAGTETAAFVDDISISGGVFVSLPTGVCCQPDGGCLENVIEAACAQQGGTYGGDGTTCDTFNCLGPAGACCLGTGECVDGLDEEGCLEIGGRYDGAHTQCGDPGLPLCCPNPFADDDADGDVDQGDFGNFQACYSGPFGLLTAGCECFDRNGDSRVDSEDFNAFLDCATGPEIPWSQSLTPDCVP